MMSLAKVTSKMSHLIKFCQISIGQLTLERNRATWSTWAMTTECTSTPKVLLVKFLFLPVFSSVQLFKLQQ